MMLWIVRGALLVRHLDDVQRVIERLRTVDRGDRVTPASRCDHAREPSPGEELTRADRTLHADL